MTVIDEVRNRLNERESKPISDNKFSKEYLTRSRCYLSVLKHKNASISNTALLDLYGNLKGASEQWRQIADSSQNSERLTENHLFFKELAELVMDELEQRTSRH